MSLSDQWDASEPSSPWLHESAWSQPLPSPRPPPTLQPLTPLPTAATRAWSPFDTRGAVGYFTASSRPSPSGGSATNSTFSFIDQQEARLRVATDLGNLMGKAPAGLGVNAQQRAPNNTDPRVRGSRVGRLGVSGSYWVPARADLDTMASKIDSRLVDRVIVIPGPYSALYGPDFAFTDVQLLPSPRDEDHSGVHGSTSADYKLNGQQVHVRQELWTASATQGLRLGIGERTGNDYTTPLGDVAASYRAQDITATYGADLGDQRRIETNLLRLDQDLVELPGQAFDLLDLVTDGYEARYELEDVQWADQLQLQGWYNRTHFNGTADNPGKRRQLPVLDQFFFQGRTDVDSLSTGYRALAHWGSVDSGRLTLGTDLRFVQQELNELTSGQIGLLGWNNANSPIPESYQANPGVLLEWHQPVRDDLTVNVGLRADWSHSEITANPAGLVNVGSLGRPYQDIVGSPVTERDDGLMHGHINLSRQFSDELLGFVHLGYGERAPSLTELYAAQPFMFVLQNGLNSVTGDPTLRTEKTLQVDWGVTYEATCWRAGARGFQAWVFDYITFELMAPPSVNPLNFQPAQLDLKYVNTDLASLLGAECYGEWEVRDWLAAFATLQVVNGTDLTRDGNFATVMATATTASVRDFGAIRGNNSGVGGGNQEPLPSISPLQARLGWRLHEPTATPRWLVELSARIVDQQEKVARSLLELPTPGFVVWDLRTRWNPTDRLQCVAGVENLGNRLYREHLDFHSRDGVQLFQPGINFYIGSEWRY